MPNKITYSPLSLPRISTLFPYGGGESGHGHKTCINFLPVNTKLDFS